MKIFSQADKDKIKALDLDCVLSLSDYLVQNGVDLDLDETAALFQELYPEKCNS